MILAKSEIEQLEGEFAARQAEALKELRAKYGDAIEQAISRARSSGIQADVEISDSAKAYACP